MDVELTGTIRGERVCVRWHDGVLSGSPALLERFRTLAEAGGVTSTDLRDTIRALELVAAQRLSLRVLEDAPRARAS